MNTYQAISVNSSLPLDERMALVKEIIEPRLLAKWNRWRFHKPLLRVLAIAMAQFKKVDSELCVKVLGSIANIRSMPLETRVEIFNIYTALGTQVLS